MNRPMKPTVGRIVHYVSYGTPGGEFASTCRAAIVAAAGPHQDNPGADEDECALVVFNPTGLFLNTVPQDEQTKKGGSWHWPERE